MIKSPESPKTADCPVCGKNLWLPLFSIPDQKGIRTELAGCSTCGTIRPEYTESLTSTNFLVAQTTFHATWWAAETAESLESAICSMDRVIDECVLFFPKEREPLVIEVGAGRGILTAALRRRGYHVESCEPAGELVDLAQRLSGTKLCRATMREFLENLPDGSVDVAFAWHVLEHLESPMDDLSLLRRKLAPGGVIIAEIPEVESKYLYPEHAFFMTPFSFQYMGAKVGFSVEAIRPRPRERFLFIVLRRADVSALPQAVKSHDVLSEVIASYNRTLVEMRAADEANMNLVRERDATISRIGKLKKNSLVRFLIKTGIVANG